jgi:uncharacterized protein (DUF433 family)
MKDIEYLMGEYPDLNFVQLEQIQEYYLQYMLSLYITAVDLVYDYPWWTRKPIKNNCLSNNS